MGTDGRQGARWLALLVLQVDGRSPRQRAQLQPAVTCLPVATCEVLMQLAPSPPGPPWGSSPSQMIGRGW